MFRDILLPETAPAEWNGLRAKMRARVADTLGTEPSEGFDGKFESTKVFSKEELEHESITFEVAPGLPCSGTFVLPPVSKGDRGNPGVLCVHGTDPELGHRNVMEPDLRPNRAYGVELAERGYVVLAVDQFGYGDWVKDAPADTLYHLFYKSFPDWSIDGIRLRIQRCALDLLAAHKLVHPERIGAIGNSLGGRTALFLAALDERLRGAVVSAGVHPNLTNVFRNLPGQIQKSPRLNQQIYDTGRAGYEMSELMALVAPRGLLVLEPWNDPYNPFVEAVLECFARARRAYEILGHPEQFAILAHGLGHDTPDEIRDYAYAVLDRMLGVVPEDDLEEEPGQE